MSRGEDVLKFDFYKYCKEVFGKAKEPVRPLRVVTDQVMFGDEASQLSQNLDEKRSS